MASAVAMVAVFAGTMGRAAADQTGAGGAFGPGRCGPIDASYVRVANATGGQALPLGPTEVGAAAPLMAASFNAETVFWATAPLTSSGQTITVPVDGVTSRVAFVLSTDGSIADMTSPIRVARPSPRGRASSAFSFGCVRGFAVERPVAGEWTVRAAGAGTYWFVVHARSDLGLDDAAFVQVAGRPAHEGLFKIPGQPVAGRPATLRARVTREDVTDATFDLVSMSGARLQAIELSPVTASSTEEEYVGEIANLPSIPFRVRVSGRDRTGAVYQRVSRPAFHAATVEVVAPQTVTLARGQRTPVTVVPADGTPLPLRSSSPPRVQPTRRRRTARLSRRRSTRSADYTHRVDQPERRLSVTVQREPDHAAFIRAFDASPASACRST